MDKTGRNGLRVGDLLDKSFTTSYIKLRLKHQRLLDNYSYGEDITSWEEEFFEAVEFLKTLNIVNGEYFINDHIQKGKKVLAEGAHGKYAGYRFWNFPFRYFFQHDICGCMQWPGHCSAKNKRRVWCDKSLLYPGRKRSLSRLNWTMKQERSFAKQVMNSGPLPDVPAVAVG